MSFFSRLNLMGILLALGTMPAFAQLNINFLGQLTYSEELSDIWGYHDAVNNREYALVGVFDGFSVVDVTNPAAPVEVQFVSGAGSTWRDIKVWGDYAYVTNESAGGLLICDLSGLPASMPTFTWDGGVGFNTAHNIFIDENGIGYLCGSGGGLGTLFIDIPANPTNPPVIGDYSERYVHDLFVRGDTMWSAEINDGIFSVIDVSDKSNPLVMATQATSSNFTHNIWLNDQGSHVFTTDEVSGAFIDAYDVSDLTDIQQDDLWQSNPGSGVIVHNTFVIEDFLVTSYYRDGVTITDITHPDNMIQTGFYDTSPLSGDNFNGCWGVYPYLPSGNILATDIEEGLFVLGPTYVQASYLEGTVTDMATTVPLSGVTVELTAMDADPANTNITGEYATGSATPGMYDVTFSKVGYISKTISGVTITSGAITILDTELEPLPSFAMSGQVIDGTSGLPVPFAHVLFESDDAGVFNLIADASGNFSLSSFFEGTYDVYAGQWNYQTVELLSEALDGTSVPYTIEIFAGLYDDFIFDFDWTATSTASSGEWVRDQPELTTSGGGTPVNPGADVTADFGVDAYVTGNAGGGAGTDDVDNGSVVLRSPSFDLTPYGDPRITFARWFHNSGGFGGPPDDSLIVLLTNGTDLEVIDLVLDGDFTESTWSSRDIRVTDFMPPTATMNFVVRTSDLTNGHLVEGGLDFWQVYDADVSGPPTAALVVDTVCGPGFVNFEDASTGNPISWYWEFPGASPAFSTEQNPSVEYTAAGTYDVTLTVYNGDGTDAQVFTSAVVVPELLELSGTVVNSTTGSDGSATVTISGGTAPYNILWDDPAVQTTETAIGLGGGEYSVIVTDANGCMETITLTINGPANGLEQLVGLEISTGANPFRESTTINWSYSGSKLNYRVMDMHGRVKDGGDISGGMGVLQIGSAWNAGVYVVEFTDGANSGSIKLIKQ